MTQSNDEERSPPPSENSTRPSAIMDPLQLVSWVADTLQQMRDNQQTTMDALQSRSQVTESNGPNARTSEDPMPSHSTAIPRPTKRDNNSSRIKIKRPDKKDLYSFIDPQNRLQPIERNTLLDTILSIANDAVRDHSALCGNRFETTWVGTPHNHRATTIKFFENTVWRQKGVDISTAQCSWFATHVLSERWDNRFHHRRRKR